MSRYIDANSLICNLDKGLQGTARDYLKFFVMAINDQPAADVAEVKHGYWKRLDETQALFSVEWSCSECGQDIRVDGILTAIGAGWIYCPRCGAKMDGGQDNG